MRQAPARPEQPQSPLEIIRGALRAAALAPTYQDALDVTGDALRHLAEIARELETIGCMNEIGSEAEYALRSRAETLTTSA
ncbi:hypothetical protein G3O06_19850 [Burkholderia sp. Ac-20345]|uniref:hypothetical protein n=1 Tax=Burkholderia sp. Ac-20345 TaxID=2703891 RepID=UPI00197BD5FD|nr:hypothetical protein [Burkholderia sp. Ac-20345]MBN3779794.1 hypothetical protein [Burkholderia sp. Ac-20345]